MFITASQDTNGKRLNEKSFVCSFKERLRRRALISQQQSTTTFLTFDPVCSTGIQEKKHNKKNLFHSARWSQQRRANLADKHELVVAECPLCDFNALSQWMEGKSLLWQRAEQTREERLFQTRCAITSVALRCLRTSPDRFDFVLWAFVADISFLSSTHCFSRRPVPIKICWKDPFVFRRSTDFGVSWSVL